MLLKLDSDGSDPPAVLVVVTGTLGEHQISGDVEVVLDQGCVEVLYPCPYYTINIKVDGIIREGFVPHSIQSTISKDNSPCLSWGY